MKDKERDKFDDLFRSKLYDFEVDTIQDDWEMIADRLPGAVSIPFYRKAAFWGAAAVVAVLMVMGSIFIFEKEQVSPQIAQEIQQKTEELDSRVQEEIIPTRQKQDITGTSSKEAIKPVIAKTQGQTNKIENSVKLPIMEGEDDINEEQPTRVGVDEQRISEAASGVEDEVKDAATESPGVIKEVEQPFIAQVTPDKSKKEKGPRKWGFGMGAGGLSIGANNIVPDYMVSTMGLRSEDLLLMNAANPNKSLPKTDVHHNKPISFGLGVSRSLNNRFSLGSGLTYSYLSSNWETKDEYHVKTTQRLHFIGIPLSLTYKIAEWNRINFYASTGFLAELNVAGNQKGELLRDAMTDDVVIDTNKKSVRMKELLFSANAKVGLSYPVLSFLSAYGEVGASYYFDNGSAFFDKQSDRPTIYSEKPFNVNLQLGFRFNF